MYESLLLMTPDSIELIFMDMVQRKCDPEKIKQKIYELELLLLECQSELKLTLQTHYRNLEELKTSLQDKRTAILYPYARKSDYINI